MNAYNFAQMDWWEAPKIHRIEQKKGLIRVRATDNVLVTQVWVTVLDVNGKMIEAGEAVKKRGSWWEFATQVPGQTITAEAWDLPGHVTKLNLSLRGGR